MKEEEKVANNLHPEVMLLRFMDEHRGDSEALYWLNKAW